MKSAARGRIEKEDLSIVGLRFYEDKFVPDTRFDLYKREFGFEAIEIAPEHAARSPGGTAHSVLSLKLKDVPGEPTKQAEERVVASFRKRRA